MSTSSEHSSRTCRQWGPKGFLCTEPNAHGGDHVARGTCKEVYERWPQRALPALPLPSVEALARALFETDQRVRDLLQRVGDACPRTMREGENPLTFASTVLARWDRALQVAWDRDEQGWRTEALARADAVLDVLKRPQ